MKLESKFFTLLGFAAKAGALVYGTAKCEAMIKCGRSRLLLVDEVASDRSKKDARNMCRNHRATLVEVSGGELGHSCGRQGKLFIAVMDKNFEKKLLELVQDKDSEESAEV